MELIKLDGENPELTNSIHAHLDELKDDVNQNGRVLPYGQGAPSKMANVLKDLALRDSNGVPATHPIYAPLGVVKLGTNIPILKEGVVAGGFSNRSVITQSGLNVWGVAGTYQIIAP